MIYIERKIKIKRNQAKIEEPIVLYRGDMNIELKFSIENNPFKFRTEKTFGRLIIKRPEAKPIFSEPVEMSESRVIFIVTGDMIDGLDAEGNPANEEGAYDFQIQLLNSESISEETSIGSLPEVTGGIIIKEPLCEGAATNVTYVNKRNAYVMPENDMATFSLRDTNAIFDEEGNYIKTYWEGGDIITDDRLNKVEDALYKINDNIPTDYVNIDFVDYAIINNNEYIEDYMDGIYTKKTDMYAYATTEYVSDYINGQDYVNHDYMIDMINDNNKYIEDYVADNYITEEYVADYVNGLDYVNQDYMIDIINDNNKYIEDYVADNYATNNYVDEAIANIDGVAGPQGPQGEPGPMGPQGEPGPAGKDADPVDLEGYATEDYVDNAISNIEIPEGGNNLPIRVIGNGPDAEPYILTGNEFTDEEYENYWEGSVYFNNVSIMNYTFNDLFTVCVCYWDKNSDGVMYKDIYIENAYRGGHDFDIHPDTGVIEENWGDNFVYYDDLEDYATKEELQTAISNIEIPESGGNELPIRVIGNGADADEYIFTGNEFTTEEYDNCWAGTILFENVRVADDLINGINYVMLDSCYMCIICGPTRLDFSIYLDTGEIIKDNHSVFIDYSLMTNYVDNSISNALGDIESLLGGI